MKKLSIEQQELLQQMVQGNDLREITPFKALEMIKKQVGNIHVFTDEMPPQQTTIELRNSGWFEIIEQAFDEYLILQKMRAEYKAIEKELGIDLVTFLKGVNPNTCFMEITKDKKLDFCGDAYHGTYTKEELLKLIQQLLFMYWALTREELGK